MIAHAMLDLGSRQLNERLEKITLRRSGANHVPQFLEYLMALPPKAKIHEIDAIAILLGIVPPVEEESGMTFASSWQGSIPLSSGTRCLSGNVRVRWKWAIGITPLMKRRDRVSHRGSRFGRHSGRRLDLVDESP